MRKPLIILLSAVVLGASANPLTLHYNRPAKYYEEALVTGNGTLGATIYGGTDRDVIQLNDMTFWTGEPEKEIFNPNAYKAVPLVRERLFAEDYRGAEQLVRQIQGHESEKYQPIGSLVLEYPEGPQVESYQRSLNLNTSTLLTSYKRDGVNFSTDYFTSAPDSALIIRLKSDRPMQVRLRFESEQPIQASASEKQMTIDGYAAFRAQAGEQHQFDPNRGIHFRTIIRPVLKNGTLTPNADGTILIDGSTEALIMLVNATSFNGAHKDPVKEGRPYKQIAQARMDRLQGKSFDALLKAHLKDYQELFGRVSLDLGDTPASVSVLPTDEQLMRYTVNNEYNPDLEELYFQFGRYLLICSSRTKGVPPNLQGIWNRSMTPPWSSGYTININLEENFWAAEVTNLSELHQSLMDFIAAMSKSGEQTAKYYYGVEEGWCSGHNTDIWAMTNPVGRGQGATCWANWTMGGAWLSTHIWEHFVFSRDRDFLRQYFPYLRGAALFCLNWLVEKDGYLLTAPCTSPENSYLTDEGYHGATLYGGFADLAIIRECLSDALYSAQELGIDKPLQKRIEQALPRLLPYRIGKQGNLQEWYHDWRDPEPRHRHQSHLIGLYPGHHITVDDTPELAQAASKTLEIKGDETTGWSAGWRVNLFARLRDSRHAYGIFKKLLRYVSPDEYKGSDARRGGGTYPNLWDAHAPFQIDGNFGGCAGIAEMLMQSSATDIHLLPALPEQWSNGNVRGLCARGGFEVAFQWEDGRVISAEVTSRHGGKTTVHCNGQTFRLKLKAGQTKRLPLN